MKRLPLASFVALFVLSAFGTSALAADAVLLRYQYKQGEKLRYHMMMKQNMTLTSSLNPNAPQKAGSKMEVDFFHKTKGSQAELKQVEMGFERVVATVEMGGQQIPVPGIDEMSKIGMTFDMDGRGQMTKVELVGAEQVGPQAAQIANEMKKSLAQNALVFPEKKVARGESWTITQKVPTRLPGASGDMVPMTVKTVYKYVGMEKHKDRQVARIDTVIKVSLHGKGQQMGVPIQTDLEGAGDGVAYFDVARGQLFESSADFLVKGKVSGSSKGQPVTTDMKIDMKVTMGLK